MGTVLTFEVGVWGAEGLRQIFARYHWIVLKEWQKDNMTCFTASHKVIKGGGVCVGTAKNAVIWRYDARRKEGMMCINVDPRLNGRPVEEKDYRNDFTYLQNLKRPE